MYSFSKEEFKKQNIRINKAYYPTRITGISLVTSVLDPYPDPHGSALNLSPGSGSTFQMRIRIQLLIKLAPKAKIIHIIYIELFD
jgi:hypothetical protein